MARRAGRAALRRRGPTARGGTRRPAPATGGVGRLRRRRGNSSLGWGRANEREAAPATRGNATAELRWWLGRRHGVAAAIRVLERSYPQGRTHNMPPRHPFWLFFVGAGVDALPRLGARGTLARQPPEKYYLNFTV